jgi:DNA-binding NarL/FixJ family response regulator
MGRIARRQRKATRVTVGARAEHSVPVGTAARPLTGRERQIVDALLAGCANKEIARQLGVSDQTIKNQLTTLYAKVGVTSRLELVLWAMNKRRSDDF